MSGRTDWKEIFGKPDQGFVNRVHATLEGLTEAGTSRYTPQHFRRRRLLTLTAVLVLLAGAALAAAEYGVLDFLLGIHEQPQRREVLEPLVTPVNAEAEAGAVSLEISGVWTDGEMLAMDWRIQNREPQTPVYVQIDQWTLNGIRVGSDGSDSFDCQWLPGLYAPDGVMQDGEVIALPGEAKGENAVQMELAVGVYTPIDPVYAMDSFDPEEAGRKTEQGYFVIAGGEGLTAQEGDAWYQCFGRIDAALDPALAARFKRQELHISLSLDMTCANACREPLTVRERYTCNHLMARYESAVLTPLGLYVQLVAEPAEGTREAAEALFNGSFELTDGEGAPLDAELLSGEKGVQPMDGGGWGVRFSAVWAVPDASPLPQTLAVSYHDASGAQLLCMPLERGETEPPAPERAGGGSGSDIILDLLDFGAQRPQLLRQVLVAALDVPGRVLQDRFPGGDHTRQHHGRARAQIGAAHHAAAQRMAALHQRHVVFHPDMPAQAA